MPRAIEIVRLNLWPSILLAILFLLHDEEIFSPRFLLPDLSHREEWRFELLALSEIENIHDCFREVVDENQQLTSCALDTSSTLNYCIQKPSQTSL